MRGRGAYGARGVGCLLGCILGEQGDIGGVRKINPTDIEDLNMARSSSLSEPLARSMEETVSEQRQALCGRDEGF